MPSLALGTAAGAGEGLESLLQRLMEEEALRQRQSAMDEQGRHNRATEVLTGRNIEETAAARAEATAARVAASEATAGDRQDRAIQTRVQLRPIDAPVPVHEVSEDLDAGISLGNFQFGGKTAPLIPATARTPDLTGGAGARVDEAAGREAAESQMASNPFANWKGTAAQQVAQQNANTSERNAADPGGSTAVRKYTIPGQGIVEARVNPTTGARTLFDGTPLPANAVPYEAPPSMTLVQTNDGFMQVPSRGGTARPVMGPDGSQVQPIDTATSRAMQEGAQKLLPLPERVMALAETMGPEQFGIVASRLRSLALKVGSVEEFEAALGTETAGLDRLSARFATELGLLASGLGRVHGGARGGGSITMIQYMRGLLGDVGTLDVLRGRIDAARDILGMYANGQMPPLEADALLGGGGGGGGVGGGLPAVGGTFNGGRVISVTPVPNP